MNLVLRFFVFGLMARPVPIIVGGFLVFGVVLQASAGQPAAAAPEEAAVAFVNVNLIRMDPGPEQPPGVPPGRSAPLDGLAGRDAGAKMLPLARFSPRASGRGGGVRSRSLSSMRSRSRERVTEDDGALRSNIEHADGRRDGSERTDQGEER